MNKNYWPLGIFLFALVVVGLIVLTIKTAITNPVELQRMCQRSSQDVDENINEITKLQTEFLKKYVINFEGAREQTSKEFRQAFIRITSKKVEQYKVMLRLIFISLVLILLEKIGI